ncbi:MAG TPA: L,D-transpeptidase [Opitutaceae bacterium]|nr:L,D-transpeptidase [Opitutaceae bacterium]
MEAPIKLIIEKCAALGIKSTNRLLVIRISTQTMQFYVNEELIKAYTVSTSKRSPSNIKGSLGTPRGLHEVAERIGGGQPIGMVFKARVPIGQHFREMPDSEENDNLITSRILWLRGLEPRLNAGDDVDTYQRYVYIHGTNREDMIGEPWSAGCVLMRNLEIIELYEQVRVGDQVFISD